MIPKSFVNRYSEVFEPALQETVAALLTQLEEALMGKLVILDPESRKGRLRIGPTSYDFTNQCYGQADRNRPLCPPYYDHDEFKRDLDAMNYLRGLRDRFALLMQAIEDSLLLSGAEAYEAARVFYGAVKAAMAAKQPGAAAIYAVLAAHFAKQGRAASADTGSESESDAESDADALGAFEPPALEE